MPHSAVTGRTMDEIAEARKKASGIRTAAPRKSQGRRHPYRCTAAPARAKKRSPRRSSRCARKPRRATAKSAKSRRAAQPLPDFIPPSLATLRTSAPDGAGWVHEIKFDGYRIQARIDHGKVRLMTRTGLDWTHKFPNVAAAVAALPADDAILDGEIVVEDAQGRLEFLGAAGDLKNGRHDRLVYYVFDLLHLDGQDLRDRR